MRKELNYTFEDELELEPENDCVEVIKGTGNLKILRPSLFNEKYNGDLCRYLVKRSWIIETAQKLGMEFYEEKEEVIDNLIFYSEKLLNSIEETYELDHGNSPCELRLKAMTLEQHYEYRKLVRELINKAREYYIKEDKN